jgi:hypothetical protein
MLGSLLLFVRIFLPKYYTPRYERLRGGKLAETKVTWFNGKGQPVLVLICVEGSGAEYQAVSAPCETGLQDSEFLRQKIIESLACPRSEGAAQNSKKGVGFAKFAELASPIALSSPRR